MMTHASFNYYDWLRDAPAQVVRKSKCPSQDDSGIIVEQEQDFAEQERLNNALADILKDLARIKGGAI